MQISLTATYELLDRSGIWAREACDRCGQVLGAVRFTRRGDAGVWCSSACRGDRERPVIHRGGRPRKHATDADKQRSYRASLGVTKPISTPLETKDLQRQKQSLSHHPLIGAERTLSA
jgi:hypothetical protein